MLSVYRTAVLSTTRIVIHVQRIVKNENSQDSSTIQTVLESIQIAKESQRKNTLSFGHCSIWGEAPLPKLILTLFLKTSAESLAGKGEGLIWAGYKALQSTKYATTKCAQECTQPSAQYKQIWPRTQYMHMHCIGPFSWVASIQPCPYVH